jgi:hypothetical protein
VVVARMVVAMVAVVAMVVGLDIVIGIRTSRKSYIILLGRDWSREWCAIWSLPLHQRTNGNLLQHVDVIQLLAMTL